MSEVHDWHIDEREYARHETRRGRRHAFTSLLPERTALVVVDLVPFFLVDNPYARVEFLGEEVAETYRLAGGAGEPRERLSPDLEVAPEDVVVEKSSACAFFPGHSPLHGLLSARGVDTVHNATLHTVYRSFGDVRATEEVLDLLACRR